MHFSVTPLQFEGRLLNSRLARVLGEMCLIHITLRCLAHAHDFTLVFPDMPEMQEPHAALGAALFRDSILQFYECFKPSGGRTGYYLDPTKVFGSGTETETLFGRLKAIRDGYAAHRFGTGQQVSVVAIIGENGRPCATVAMATGMVGFDSANREQFKQILLRALDFVQLKIEEVRKLLDAELESMTIEDLAALPTFERRDANIDDISRSRDNFDGLTKGRQ